MSEPARPPAFSVAGVRLDALPVASVSRIIADWCGSPSGRPRTVCLVNAFSIASASRDEAFREAINTADMSVTDGAPVAWLGRWFTGSPCERLSGPDLMHAMLSDPRWQSIRHFVYGGDADSLVRIEARYNKAGISPRIVGSWSPPYRDLSPAEEEAMVARLNGVDPDIIWVCLGTAKQEKWMARLRPRLQTRVLVGVGAAVDFLSGGKPRAPQWMQRAGLEWLFRLASEPRRLWRRYLIGNVVFMRLAGLELLKRHPAVEQGGGGGA
jgi:N-acetylglucosaminyldiphosphoundecaprenol N-acetyl-beta-D-mannosaminyltransferase